MSSELEYRPVRRLVGTTEWQLIETRTRIGVYSKASTAKAIATRQKNEDEHHNSWASRDGIHKFEYDVQVREPGEWKSLDRMKPSNIHPVVLD